MFSAQITNLKIELSLPKHENNIGKFTQNVRTDLQESSLVNERIYWYCTDQYNFNSTIIDKYFTR